VHRLLVVEDDPALASSLQRTLTFEGYEVLLAKDGEEAWAMAYSEGPDCLVLDVGLPGVSGLEVARRLRRRGDKVPILMLTARQMTGDRVAGLDAGADDYITKPFEVEELLARIRALMRRSGYTAEESQALSVADLVLDMSSHEVWRGSRDIELTRTEFLLLEHLMLNQRQVLSRAQLLRHVWGIEFDSSTNTVEVFISYLRRKIEAGGEARLIHTVRGAGYIIREPRQ
jgi:two-component system, OmpR family, response regulator MprA